MLRKYRRTIERINSFDLSTLNDSALSSYGNKFRAQLDTGRNPWSILPEVFAVLKEVIDRRLGVWKLFDPTFDEQWGRSDFGIRREASSYVDAIYAHELYQQTSEGLQTDKTPWIPEAIFEDVHPVRCLLSNGVKVPPELIEIVKAYIIVEEKRNFSDDSEIHLNASFYDAVRKLRVPEGELTFQAHDVQLLGALALYEGKIAEMDTGEGKTLVAVFPACLEALSGKKVHIATVNDYLALRDCLWMGPAFKFLGLDVDCILSHMSDPERREAYKADVVYGNNYEFGFDYLRDNIKIRMGDRVQGEKLEYVIIDEIDSILIDEATTPLIISDAPFDRTGSFSALKSTVELLIKKQEQLVHRLFGEVLQYDQREPNSRIKFIKLIQIAKADPWNTNLLEYIHNHKGTSQKMQSIERKLASARSEYKLEDGLFYIVDEKHRAVKLTDRGQTLVARELGEDFFILDPQEREEADSCRSPLAVSSSDTDQSKSERLRNFLQLLRAYVLHRKDEDYIIHDGRIVLVDEFTGRLAFGKKYEQGLHQAIEIKEGLNITAENRVVGKITHPNYFRLYEKMAGMTATASTEAEEFRTFYNLEVVRIPTHKPVIRADLLDRFYKTNAEKLKGILGEIQQQHRFGRPVLVGTRSVEKSEQLSAHLKRYGIPHKTLNAKNHAEEADIIKLAGQPYAVTIATNMAGRGTDIPLGKDLHQIVIGNYINYFREQLKKGVGVQINTYSQLEFDLLSERLSQEFDMEYQRTEPPDSISTNTIFLGGQTNGSIVIDFGLGLHVIGSERHTARRIDVQLRGRAGRQGDPGSSRFHLSAQDDLFRIFGTGGEAATVKAFQQCDNEAIARLVRRTQRKSEASDYGVRKQLIEYDTVIDRQRKAIYQRRLDILGSEDTKALVFDLIVDHVDKLIGSGRYVHPDRPKEEWKIQELEEYCATNFGIRTPDLSCELSIDAIRESLIQAYRQTYNWRERILGEAFCRKLEKAVMIHVLDVAWADYLSFLIEFDATFSFGSHVRHDTLTDYRMETSKLFGNLLASIASETLRSIFAYPLPGEKAGAPRRGERSRSISDHVQELLTVQ